MNKKLAFILVAVAGAASLVHTKAVSRIPSDLRDAVAEDSRALELNTELQAAGANGAQPPAVSPAAAEKLPAAPAAEQPPIGNFGVVLTLDPDNRGKDTAGLDGVIFRGGSLDNEAGYAYLQKLGVTALANLQSTHQSDPAFCEKYGLTCRNFGIYPFDMIKLTKSPDFQQAFRFVLEERKAGHKVYIHCMKGKDRTGALAAALIIREDACDGDFNGKSSAAR